MLFNSFAVVTGTLVSNLIGAGHADQVLKLVRRSAILAYVASGVFLVFFMLFPNPFLRIFTDNMVLLEVTRENVYAVLVNIIFQTGAFVVFNAVSGTGNTFVALMIELLSAFAYALTVYFVVILLKSNVALCWLCDSVYAISIGVASLIYLWRGRWKNHTI